LQNRDLFLGTGIAHLKVQALGERRMHVIDHRDRRSFRDSRERSQPPTTSSSPTLTWLRQRLLKIVPFQVVLAAILVVLPFAVSRNGLADPDIWWHLRNAEYLFQHHQLPRYDNYSFTVAGHAWINHEWLSEIPYYLAYRSFGLVGVKSLSLALITLIFLGLLHLCHTVSGNFKSSFAACSFTVFLATVSFGPRTILFGYLYLVILLILLERFRRHFPAPLWLIPPLFLLWVNTHGSWLLGLIIFSIVLAAGCVRGSWGRIQAERWSFTQFRALLLTYVASIAALFANPFGARLVFYPFDLAFRQKLNISHVAEWVSVDFHTFRGKLVLGLIILFLLSALVRGTRWTLTEIVVLLFGLYSGLTYIRFLFLLSIVAAPLIAKNLDFFPPYRVEMDTPIVNALVVIAIIAGMTYYWPKTAELQRSIDQEYPTEALSYLRAHPPASPVLNFYLWGGYLGWKDNNFKVFLDSRVDIFEYSGVLADYLDLLGVEKAKPILDKYGIRSVLFPVNEPVAYFLEHDPGWKVVYHDKLCVLLERAEPFPERSAATTSALPDLAFSRAHADR
jgi:hypothetical protein